MTRKGSLESLLSGFADALEAVSSLHCNVFFSLSRCKQINFGRRDCCGSGYSFPPSLFSLFFSSTSILSTIK